ncbi:MAG TPA: hydroxymethylglutaryl-CoA reductase, degradative [Anaerolineales bacterium]|nr:hydroxymethylglutaryl-CoA reductase, degradative [Anaerolineales bacterium]
MATSRLAGFYDLPLAERRRRVAEATALADLSLLALGGEAGLKPEQADHMIENVIGVFGLPLGIAVNFVVNGREVLVPMAIEEPSVVAGASFMAKLVREGGGFHAETDAPEMIAQIQVLGVADLEAAKRSLETSKDSILAEADAVDPVIRNLGGGARDLVIRLLPETAVGPMLVVHLVYDVRDAMGANAVNTAAERLAPRIEAITGGRVHLRILTNLADRRLARATCRIPAAALAFGDFSGDRVRDGIVEAWALADADPYRAATHNKGIMNGVDSVVIATGNDWRAVEAGAHAFAARSGRYTSLSRWAVGADGSLEGWLEMPMAVGIVGGATRVHPTARAALELMGVRSARELSAVIVSVGLAQNLAALRALATEGIQRGHMGLHARQVAMAAGASGEWIERVARQMMDEGLVRSDRAEQVLRELRGGTG